MLSKIAKVLFPLSLFAYMFLVALDVATSKIGLLTILPPPHTGVVLVILLVANVIYLLTFSRPRVVDRILLAFGAPFTMLLGGAFVGLGILGIRGDGGEPFCLFWGMMTAGAAIVLYVLVYERGGK